MNSENLPVDPFHGLIIGDEETFVFLFKEYYVSLCSYARRYVGRKDIAEEIVSDTFLKIWESRNTLNIYSSIKGYLFHAVCNNSLNYLRNIKKENIIETYFQDPKFENMGFAEILEETDEQSLISENISTKIEEAVSQLPRQQQSVFRLKRQEGKKIREVAQLMGLSVKTVEVHLSKASINLQHKLKKYLPSFLLLMLFK